MANRVWGGNAPLTAEVVTLTVGGTVEIGDKFIATRNSKSVTVSATTTLTATTAGEVATAWNASTETEHAEYTALAVGSTVTLTAGSTGIPGGAITATTTESGGGAADAQTFTASVTTAGDGPNGWSVAANWVGGVVPVDGDDVFLEHSSVSILSGLNQSAVTLASLTKAASYTGSIGLSRTNAAGYLEDRETYLRIGATTVTVGLGEGSGSDRFKLDTGSVQTNVKVYSTGTSSEEGLEALLWKGTHASNEFHVLKGSVGIARFAGETATLSKLRVAYLDNQTGDSTVRASDGLTLATLEQSGGTVELNKSPTTGVVQGGVLTILGSTAMTTLTIYKSLVNWMTTGTLTNLICWFEGSVDFNRDLRPKTITNCDLYAQASLQDTFRAVTFTNGIDVNGCALNDVKLDVGANVRVTVGSIP